jgi:hypothetical protein
LVEIDTAKVAGYMHYNNSSLIASFNNIISILTLFGSRYENLHETYKCQMYGRKLLMMGREDDRNMWSFITE